MCAWAGAARLSTRPSTRCCSPACPALPAGFVDPSVVQLINMFTVVGVALVQSLLLRHRLPWVIWPSMVVMLGGGEAGPLIPHQSPACQGLQSL